MQIRTWITALGVGVIVVASGCGGSSNKSTNPPTPKVLDSGTMGTGAHYAHTFSTPGTFGYHCQFHVNMGMVGSVTVSDAEPAQDKTVTLAGTSFTPPGITAHTGNKVTWTNNGGTHTVTSD